MTDEQQADKQIADAMDRIPIAVPTPAMVAFEVVQSVMNRNRVSHEAAGDLWEERSEFYHLDHASDHMDAVFDAHDEQCIANLPDSAVEDAEHALCRLAMALAKRRMRMSE